MAFAPQPRAFQVPQPTTPLTSAPAAPLEGDVGAQMAALVQKLLSTSEREEALTRLSREREKLPDLARWLWYSTGVMAVLLQEIIRGYPILQPAYSHTQSGQSNPSNRVCNALALVQCIAASPETRPLFVAAQVPLYLYPFLSGSSSERNIEYLRLTSLGVIGALVKSDEENVVKFLLGTDIVPICLKIMDAGTDLSKTVATFILHKIVAHDIGLSYVCQSPERFMAVARALQKMVMEQECGPRLLKNIIKCYLRLTDHKHACDALQKCLPQELRDGTFKEHFMKDDAMGRQMMQLLVKIRDPNAIQEHSVVAQSLQPGIPALR